MRYRVIPAELHGRREFEIQVSIDAAGEFVFLKIGTTWLSLGLQDALWMSRAIAETIEESRA